jgi:hypothetical protein
MKKYQFVPTKGNSLHLMPNAKYIFKIKVNLEILIYVILVKIFCRGCSMIKNFGHACYHVFKLPNSSFSGESLINKLTCHLKAAT